MFYKAENWKEHIKAVTGSAIVAKAVTRRNNGAYEIIVVFQKSTRQEFFWIFQTRSPRTPQRAWKFVGHSARDVGFSDKHSEEFGEFVDRRAALQSAQVLSVRVLQKRRLSALRQKVECQTIYTAWPADADRPAEVVTTDKLRRRWHNGASSRYGVMR